MYTEIVMQYIGIDKSYTRNAELHELKKQRMWKMRKIAMFEGCKYMYKDIPCTAGGGDGQ